MYIETKPFPYLKLGQYADMGNGEILFLDETINEDDKEKIRRQYREWWHERQAEKEESGYE